MKEILIVPKHLFTVEKITSDIQKGIVRPNAISWTAANGHATLTRSLINLGANVIENCNYPLELASKNGHTEIVKMLLAAGARTNSNPDDEGYCLRVAAYGGFEEIVKLLLEAGANPMADCYVALKFALDEGHRTVVEMLINAICKKKNSNNKV